MNMRDWNAAVDYCLQQMGYGERDMPVITDESEPTPHAQRWVNLLERAQAVLNYLDDDPGSGEFPAKDELQKAIDAIMTNDVVTGGTA